MPVHGKTTNKDWDLPLDRRTIKRPMPEGFRDDAVRLSATELGEKYSASSRVVKRWLAQLETAEGTDFLKEREIGMGRKRMGVCRFNDGVRCPEQDGCAGCGWNPNTRKRCVAWDPNACVAR